MLACQALKYKMLRKEIMLAIKNCTFSPFKPYTVYSTSSLSFFVLPPSLLKPIAFKALNSYWYSDCELNEEEISASKSDGSQNMSSRSSDEESET